MSVTEILPTRITIDAGFNVLDSLNLPIGTITPSQSQPPTLTNNTAQSIKRTLTNLKLTATDTAALNPLRDRVQPYVVVSGTQYPLGVFLFADFPKRRYSYLPTEHTAVASLVDQGMILDQELSESFSVAQGANLGAAMATVLARFGIYNYTIEATTTVGGQGALFWPADTLGTKVVNDLAALCGFLPIYWDNRGVPILRSTVDPAVATPQFTYNVAQENSIFEVDVPLDVPNRYKVVDNGVTDSPIIATFDVPDTAPHSYANRGFYVSRTITAQGIGSAVAALSLARQQADTDIQAYQQFSFAHPVDPRHDTFNVVQWLGVSYLERRWSWTMRAGSDMTHELVRIYR